MDWDWEEVSPRRPLDIWLPSCVLLSWSRLVLSCPCFLFSTSSPVTPPRSSLLSSPLLPRSLCLCSVSASPSLVLPLLLHHFLNTNIRRQTPPWPLAPPTLHHLPQLHAASLCHPLLRPSPIAARYQGRPDPSRTRPTPAPALSGPPLHPPPLAHPHTTHTHPHTFTPTVYTHTPCSRPLHTPPRAV